MVKPVDRIRISVCISKMEQRQEERKLANQHDHLQRLKRERFGNTNGQHSSIFNFTDLELSTLEKEVLSRGLKFGIPGKTPREEVLAEFEVLYQQLRSHPPTSKEAADSCRIRLAYAADSFQRMRNDQQGFSFTAEHLKIIKSLKANKDIVIIRPDKGQGTVLMKRSEYTEKMLQILNDGSKFKKLGKCPEHDHTAQIERSMQPYY